MIFSILQSCATIAAAKSLQSCPTLCDPMDCSPPGFSVHGILQARTLEWGAISFSMWNHYYHSLILKQFHHLPKIIQPIWSHSQFPSPAPGNCQSSSHLYSFKGSCEICVFWVYRLSFNIMFLTSSHVVACISTLFLFIAE